MDIAFRFQVRTITLAQINNEDCGDCGGDDDDDYDDDDDDDDAAADDDDDGDDVGGCEGGGDDEDNTHTISRLILKMKDAYLLQSANRFFVCTVQIFLSLYLDPVP